MILSAMALMVVGLVVFCYLAWTEEDSRPEHGLVFAIGACVPSFLLVALLVVCFVLGLFGNWGFLDDAEFALGIKVAFVVLCGGWLGLGALASRLASAYDKR